ncbi:hypothetical protein [Deinococcus sp.]|uniref:hypothetical protein n=1 Tax=Deinococcus sp. TaxID=47478 RepID=UPI003B5CD9F4
MYKLLLLALALASSVTLATPIKQYANIVKVQSSLKTAALTLDYVDIYFIEEDARKVIALGDYKTADEFYDANPSGIYIRNVNKKLRKLNTDQNTVFEVVCLNDEAKVRTVDLPTFVKAVRGTPPATCWPFGDTVELTLDGPRLLKVSQVYFP